jgi:hypothetical protein
MILSPNPTSWRQLTWDPNTRQFIGEVSSLGRPGFGRVYDDACDVGFTVVSPQGREIVLVVIFDLLLLDKDDNTVGSGFGSVEVKPGKSANSKVLASLDDDSYKGKVKCEVKVTDW